MLPLHLQGQVRNFQNFYVCVLPSSVHIIGNYEMINTLCMQLDISNYTKLNVLEMPCLITLKPTIQCPQDKIQMEHCACALFLCLAFAIQPVYGECFF